MFGHLSLSQYFQVTCHAIQCSREVTTLINNPTVLLTFHPHVIPYSFDIPCYIILMFCFMSIMGDKSRSSFDEIVPIEFNT